MATIPNQTHTQGQNGTQTAPGAAGFENQRTPGLKFDRHFTKPGISPTTSSSGSFATPSSRTSRARSSSSRRTSRFPPTGP
ncbi:hypothetical protein RBB78_00990 [Tunturiibacter empetritectus]|uniref:hypothetical protein n=1 Tax=Tunturiibacter empetritectus TaxID=3069691 RepID=UPI003D9BC364